MNRYLIITRGAPGSCKSIFVNNTFDESFEIICPDEIRLKINGLDEFGRISQKDSNEVWSMAYDEMLKAFKKSKNIVFDSTCVDKTLLKKSRKLCSANGYEMIILDFTSWSYEECLEHNYQREEYKRVSPDILKNIYDRLNNQNIDDYKQYVVDFKDFELDILK